MIWEKSLIFRKAWKGFDKKKIHTGEYHIHFLAEIGEFKKV